MNDRASLLLSAVISMAVVSPHTEARTATTAEREACVAALQKRIDAIDARMRQPYAGREGERLREKRDQLEKAREACRVKQ